MSGQHHRSGLTAIHLPCCKTELDSCMWGRTSAVDKNSLWWPGTLTTKRTNSTNDCGTAEVKSLSCNGGESTEKVSIKGGEQAHQHI